MKGGDIVVRGVPRTGVVGTLAHAKALTPRVPPREDAAGEPDREDRDAEGVEGHSD